MAGDRGFQRHTGVSRALPVDAFALAAYNGVAIQKPGAFIFEGGLMNTKRQVLTVRVTPAERAALSRAAEARGKTVSECLRLAVAFGLPFVQSGHGLDLYRVIANIEYLQAAIETIIAREHSDVTERLLDVAIERMEQFHA